MNAYFVTSGQNDFLIIETQIPAGEDGKDYELIQFSHTMTPDLFSWFMFGDLERPDLSEMDDFTGRPEDLGSVLAKRNADGLLILSTSAMEDRRRRWDPRPVLVQCSTVKAFNRVKRAISQQGQTSAQFSFRERKFFLVSSAPGLKRTDGVTVFDLIAR